MNLIKSTGTFGFYTIISRLLGYIRDILIAIFLGTGLLADAFFVAFRIPNTFRRLFSEGTFNAAFVPSYTSEMNKGKKSANNFANNIFNLLFLGLLILIISNPIFYIFFLLSPAETNVEILALQYIEIRALSAPFAIATIPVIGWLIALEKTRSIFYIQIFIR